MATVDLGKGYVQIVPSAKGVSNAIQSEISPGATAAGKMAGQNVAAGLSTRLKSLGGGLMKAGAIATAVSVPIIAGIKSSLSAYAIQEAAETKLTEIYKTRMGATADAAKATMEYASALQQEGIIGDEVLLSGGQQLATFAKMPGTVNTLLPAMGNLLAQQKGYNATAQDATGIANLMGKAMQGQTGALKRVGISFDEAQEAILKTGTEEEKAAVMAQVITDNVGNMNKTMSETPLGKIQQMKNAWGDIKEEIGGAFAPVLSEVATTLKNTLLPAIEGVTKAMKDNPVIAKVVTAIAGILVIGGPLLILIGTLVSSLGAITGALGITSLSLSGIPGILTAITGALASPMAMALAAVGIIAAIVAASEPLRSALMDLGQAILPHITATIDALMPVGKALMSELASIAKTIGDNLAPIVKQLQPVLVSLFSHIASFAQTAAPVVISVIRVISAAIKAAVVIIAGTISAVITIVGKVISAIVGMPKSISKAWASMVKATKNAWKNFTKSITDAVNKAKNTASNIVTSIKTKVSDTFKSMKDAVKNTFNNFVDVIKKPFEKAKDAIKGAIDKIKSYFPINIGSVVKALRIPQLSIVGGEAPWGFGGKGSMPKIKFAAEGGIIPQAAVVAGEAGYEAMIPLDSFWARLDELSAQGNTTYNINVNIDAQDLDGVMSVKDFLRMLQRAKQFA